MQFEKGDKVVIINNFGLRSRVPKLTGGVVLNIHKDNKITVRFFEGPYKDYVAVYKNHRFISIDKMPKFKKGDICKYSRKHFHYTTIGSSPSHVIKIHLVKIIKHIDYILYLDAHLYDVIDIYSGIIYRAKDSELELVDYLKPREQQPEMLYAFL